MNYYQKYLKYKKKYLQEFVKQSGGDIDIDNLYRKTKSNNNFLSDSEKDMFNNTGNSYIYGELTNVGMEKMLKGIDTKDNIYMDLGSGSGITVKYASVNHNFKHSYGIELSNKRYNNAIRVKNHLPIEIQNKITYYNDDFLNNNSSIKKSDIIFISSIKFSDQVMNSLSKKLNNELKKGTYIFTSRELKAPRIKLLDTLNVKMTWDYKSKLYKYIVE